MKARVKSQRETIRLMLAGLKLPGALEAADGILADGDAGNLAAAQYGRRVYYATLADLVGNLEEAQAAGSLKRRLKVLTHTSLLVVGEIGYIPVSQTGAMLFFQLMSRRYEHASTVLTSNKSYDEWGEFFGDEVMAAALIDRVLHHCHIVNIRGNSFRMREHQDLERTLYKPTTREQETKRSWSDPLGGTFSSAEIGTFSLAVDRRSQGCARKPGSPWAVATSRPAPVLREGALQRWSVRSGTTSVR